MGSSGLPGKKDVRKKKKITVENYTQTKKRDYMSESVKFFISTGTM